VYSDEVTRVGEAVDPRDELRVALLPLDLRAVVLDALARPGIEVHRRNRKKPALELDRFRRPQGAEESQELLRQVVESDLVGVVVDENRSEARRGLDDTAQRGLGDLRRQTVREEVELELHLVAEFDEHVAIASGKDSRLWVDHACLESSADRGVLKASARRSRRGCTSRFSSATPCHRALREA
jgi:hypothetical protein